MWYCPECESWLGWKLDECFGCGNARPRLPLRADDVEYSESCRVDDRDRLRGKLLSLRDRLTGGSS